MFDIHYHLLFGLDDGPEDIDASLRLAEASIAEGTTHIVCTPHANDHYAFQPEVNRERVEILKERLNGRITLGLGCDFHFSYENLEDFRRNPTKYTINGGKFLLVEFPDFGIPATVGDVLFRLISSGIVPIITHPERNATLVAYPRRMIELIEYGCLIQITAGSLSGRFGKRAESRSHEWIKRNWVNIIASDAHSMDRRPPAMAQAYSVVKDQYGLDTADRLCIHTPRAAFYSDTLPRQPEPLEFSEKASRQTRGLFSRIFGR